MSRLLLNYASLPRRRWYAVGWLLEAIEVCLAIAMLVAILAMMAGAMVLVVLQHWLLAGVACVGIPLVIVACLEASEWTMRARQRAA